MYACVYMYVCVYTKGATINVTHENETEHGLSVTNHDQNDQHPKDSAPRGSRSSKHHETSTLEN